MSFVLLVVIVTGLVLGYWLVSALLSSSAPPPEAPEDLDAADDTVLEPRPARHWSVVLDVRRDVDATAIAAAYRRALQRHNAADADSPQQQALAQQQLAEIETAYLDALRNLQR